MKGLEAKGPFSCLAIAATPKNKPGRSLWIQNLHKGVIYDTDSVTADEKSSPYIFRPHKRKRKSDEWKAAQRKRNKNLGLEYRDTLGQKDCRRNVTPVTCNCKFKCRKFNFIKQSLFLKGTGKQEKQQRQFVKDHVTATGIKRRTGCKEVTSPSPMLLFLSHLNII